MNLYYIKAGAAQFGYDTKSLGNFTPHYYIKENM